jgi:HEAT repeat protein
LPALAKTPASVASYALPGIKQSSEIPDLGEVTKIEIAELVRLLASDNPDITKAATLALRNHGLSDCRIELASELATGSAVRRMELIQQLAVSPDLDPRPWLVWMAEDGQPEVRRLAVSLLSSMLDPEIERSMRMLLFREQDEPTRDQIRKVLLSASK